MRRYSKCSGRAVWASLIRDAASGEGGDFAIFIPADPCRPLGLDYRRIPLEHFLVGGFDWGFAVAQRGS